MQGMQVIAMANLPTKDRVTALVAMMTVLPVVPVAAAVGLALKLIAAMLMEVNKEGQEMSRRLPAADLMWWTQA